jgi:hypothetical protein
MSVQCTERGNLGLSQLFALNGRYSNIKQDFAATTTRTPLGKHCKMEYVKPEEASHRELKSAITGEGWQLIQQNRF